MLETLLPFVVIYFNTAVSLGVGGSSIVIASFLVALADGKIDQPERALLGVIYVTLRVAMASILAMLVYIALVAPDILPSILYFGIMVAVLYLNAILMTKHWISSKLGPALQAATWYTLGFVTVIDAFTLYEVSLAFFLTLYLVDIVIAVAAVNGIMLYLTQRRKAR